MPASYDLERVLEQDHWMRLIASSLVRDPEAAEDLAQDAWVAALGTRGGPRRPKRPWLFGVMRNLGRQRARGECRRRERERRVAREEAQPSTAELVEELNLRQEVGRALLELEDPYRRALYLRFFCGYSLGRVARETGVSTTTVHGRVRVGLARMRGRLDDAYGGDRRAWSLGLFSLARPGGLALSTSIGGIGVITMGTGIKIVGGVAAAALLVWAWSEGLAPRDAVEREAPAAGVAAAPEEGIDAPSAIDVPPSLRIDAGAREPVESAGPAVYVVLDPDERPVVDAPCRLFEPGQVLLSGETNHLGELTSEETGEGLASLLVLPEGWAPQILEVSRAPGRHILRLERGLVVSGQVLVSGEAPGKSIPLNLSCALGSGGFRNTTGLSYRKLGLPEDSSHMVRTWSDEHGFFRFQGLAANWSGELQLPVKYRLEDPTLARRYRALNTLVLDAPTEDLIVRVVKCLTLVGRVIDFADGQSSPVPGAIVQLDLRVPRAFLRAYSRGHYLKTVVTDEEGRFTFVLATQSILGGKIRIEPPGQEFFREIEVEPVEVDRELDLGDLALSDRSRTQTVSLRVVDEALQPIQGAIAATDSSAPPSAPTDEFGGTILGHVLPEVTEFTVYALGYEATEGAVPAELPEELEVVLRRGTLLDIRFVKKDGEVARNVEVRLAAAEHPYRNESAPATLKSYTQIGCSFYEVFYPKNGTVVVRPNALEEGRVVLNDLKPGLALQLWVGGRFGAVIQEEQISPLRPREHRVQEVVLARPPSSLSGRVLDEAGGVLRGWAIVTIGSPPSDSPFRNPETASALVMEQGEFEFENIYSPTVGLIVLAEGYVPFREDIEIPEEGAFIEVRLSPATEVVTVTIEDENGKRQSATSVTAFRQDGARACTGLRLEDEEGVFLLRGLPDEELTITAYVHGVPYTKSHDPRHPELLFTVPALGGVRATVHLLDESQVDDTWLLCVVPTSESAAVIQYASLNATTLTDVLPGSYYVVLRRFNSGWEHMDDFVETSLRVPIEVSAGKQEDVEIWQQL